MTNATNLEPRPPVPAPPPTRRRLAVTGIKDFPGIVIGILVVSLGWMRIAIHTPFVILVSPVVFLGLTSLVGYRSATDPDNYGSGASLPSHHATSSATTKQEASRWSRIQAWRRNSIGFRAAAVLLTGLVVAIAVHRHDDLVKDNEPDVVLGLGWIAVGVIATRAAVLCRRPWPNRGPLRRRHSFGWSLGLAVFGLALLHASITPGTFAGIVSGAVISTSIAWAATLVIPHVFGPSLDHYLDRFRRSVSGEVLNEPGQSDRTDP